MDTGEKGTFWSTVGVNTPEEWRSRPEGNAVTFSGANQMM
jgi:hypothetical protein